MRIFELEYLNTKLVLLLPARMQSGSDLDFGSWPKNTKVCIFTFVKLSRDITDYRGDGFISNLSENKEI